MKKYIIAFSGASGAVYGVRLVEELLKNECELHIIASEPACMVMEQELGWQLGKKPEVTLYQYLPRSHKITVYNNNDIKAAPASGSVLINSMVVIPCSMASVSGFANGTARSLIERCADVMLKEKRPLIIVPRETPLSTIHLRNLLVLAEAGAHIIPAMPAFYHKPASLSDIIDFMVGKVMDAMGIPNNLFERWGG